MSLANKGDVKSHLSHRHPGIHLLQPAIQSDATGSSGEESRHTDSEVGHAVQESPEQPTSTGLRTPSTPIEPGLKPALVPKVSKSAQA